MMWLIRAFSAFALLSALLFNAGEAEATTTSETQPEPKQLYSVFFSDGTQQKTVTGFKLVHGWITTPTVTRDGYVLTHWEARNTEFAPGARFNVYDDIVADAVWEAVPAETVTDETVEQIQEQEELAETGVSLSWMLLLTPVVLLALMTFQIIVAVHRFRAISCSFYSRQGLLNTW